MSFLYVLLHLPPHVFFTCHLMLLHLSPHASPLYTTCISICHLMHLHLSPHVSPLSTSCFFICRLMLQFLSDAVGVSHPECMIFFLPINRGRGIHTLFILLHAPTSIIYHNLHQSSISSLIWPIGITTSPSYHQDSK